MTEINPSHVWNVGMFFDFEVSIENDKYIKLIKSYEEFAVVIIYDYTKTIFGENVIYMNLEFSTGLVDWNVIKEFNKTINQATMIIEQIKKIENEE